MTKIELAQVIVKATSRTNYGEGLPDKNSLEVKIWARRNKPQLMFFYERAINQNCLKLESLNPSL